MGVKSDAKVKMRCAKCGSEMSAVNFYRHRDGQYDDMCKQCLCMHVNNFQPETFEWILKKFDYPYVPQEWEKTVKQAADKQGIEKLTGVSVMGRYISKMKLNNWKQYGYADSEAIQEKYNKATDVDEEKEAELKQMLEAGEITQAEYDTYMEPAVKPDPVPFFLPQEPLPPTPIDDEPLFDVQMTPEEVLQMKIKWGTYKQDEWLQLEAFYNDMLESFEIQDADSLAALKLICKTQLKMNQAIDMEDFDSYQKLSKVYNDMRKTAKFTAAQNKEESNNAFDSVGQLVIFCEKNGGAIPRYEIKEDQDKVDKTLADNKQYLYDLVTQDTALAKQIEEVAVKMSKKMVEDETEDIELTNEDFAEYFDNEESQRIADLELLEEVEDESEGSSGTESVND